MAMRSRWHWFRIDVDDRVETIEFGRFGWASDLEGNRFELWEPS